MPDSNRVALVTGASRGLGTVIAARPGRTWLQPGRRRAESRRRFRSRGFIVRAGLPGGRRRGRRDRRGCPFAAHRRRPLARRAGRTGEQRSELGVIGPLVDFDVPRLGRDLPCQRGRAARPDSAGGSAPGRAPRVDRQHHQRRRARRVSRLGPVWREQGGPGARDPDARNRARRCSAVSAVLVDPGDMRTRMHQEAFPSEDISDRPLPGRDHSVLEMVVRPTPGRFARRTGWRRSRRTHDGCSRCNARCLVAASSRSCRAAGGAGAQARRRAAARVRCGARLGRACTLP